MSNKQVIAVDIDDHQFRAFYELFKQYSADVEEMPDDWKRINGATAEAGKSLGDFAKFSDSSKESLMVAAIQADAIGKSVGEAIKAQKEFASVARTGSSELEKMAKHAKMLGSEVFGIGKFLMKIGAIGFGLTGAGAILSGFGIRDLARSAISNQGEARGIGVSPGQLSAFQTDFGRYVDPSILNRAADAQSDMRKIPYAMLATGQSLSAIQNESPDELSLRMMQRAHDWYNNTPVSMRNAQTLQGTGLNQFMSFEEVRKLGAMTPQEFSDARANYRKDAQSFSVSDKSTDAWYGFERELEAAGKLLKTDLTDRLADLAPNLREFVTNVGSDAKLLIDDVLSPQNLKAVGEALHDFTNYLGSPQFRQDLHDIAGLFVSLAVAMRKAAKFLGIDVGPTGGSGSLDPNEVQRETHGSVSGFSRAMNDNWTRYQALSPTMVDNIAGLVQKAGGAPAYFGDFEKSQNLPAGLLYAQEMVESRGKIGAVSPKGAMGPFQFMPDTAAQYKLDDPYNLHDSAAAAARMMGDMLRKYRGDIRKALAGYNWGSGNLDRDIAANGAQWESHLPAETKRYLDKITSAIAKSKASVRVDVTNSTAARVAVSTNAAATGS